MQQIVPNLYVFDEIGEMVHAYLWEWEGGATLIDTGVPSSADKITTALIANGYPLHRVRRIILTHGDVDHMGSAARLSAQRRERNVPHGGEGPCGAPFAAQAELTPVAASFRPRSTGALHALRAGNAR